LSEFVEEDKPGNNLDIFEYLNVILDNVWVIVSITALGAALSLVYFARLPNLYTANAQILVEKLENAPKEVRDMAPSFSGDDDYYGTQIAILTGRKISGMVGTELGPEAVGAKIQARRIPKTRILSLSVTHRKADLAAKVANKYSEIFVRESTGEQQFMGQQVLKLIPDEAELEKDMDMLGTLPDAGAPSIFNKKEYAESLQSVMNDPVVSKMRSEKLEIRANLVELSQRYKPSHPSIKDLNERLAYVDTELKNRMQKILNNIRANLAGEARITNVKVLEEAVPPSIPSSPQRAKGVIIHTLMAFVLSIMLVFFIENSNQQIRNELDFRHNVPLPFLGYIPLIKDFNRKKKKNLEQGSETYSLVKALKENPILSDAVASVRTHILFSMPYEKSRRIMLTSCVPDEGKTTVSVLLSLSLTALGKKILLIDADMRRPFAHNYVIVNNGKGLSDFLVGQASLDEVMQEIEGTTLKIITAGSPTVNPSELVGSERFKELLDRATEMFDRIVIDVPPVLYIPDGLIIAKHVHSGVLVCGAGMVQKKTVATVKEKFDSIGHSFIGIVINRAELDKGAHQYKYYSKYKNYYTKEKSTQS